MGCSSSRLEDEEAVQICHDRKNFIKKAITQRNLLASSHVAYVQSLRRVSLALFYYFAEDEHLYFLESCTHLPCSSDKALIQPKTGTTTLIINCLRPGWNPVFPMEEWPQPAETIRVDAYYNEEHHGINTFFHSSPYHVLSNTPASPQAPQWDFFWNPFSSLNDHRYELRNSLDHSGAANDGTEGLLREDQEDEGIPELEEESDDCQDAEPADDTAETKVDGEREKDASAEKTDHVEESEPKEAEKVADVSNELRVLGSADVEQQTPGFTVFVDRRPTSMAQAMKDIEAHFMKIIASANEVSVLLEVITYHNNVQSSAPRDDEQQSGSEVSEEPFQLFRSHKASLDRLYEWEKKLYEEVKEGERVRISYEKRCMQLKSQDANGAEPSAVDRTRAAIRDLRTGLNISFTSVESISKRITALRDDELLPQLMQLIRGLARMWRVIADAHRMQKRTIDEASVLLSSTYRPTATAPRGNIRGPPPPPGPTCAATAAGALGAELRSWRAALAAWAESQRAYAAALSGWARSCVSDGSDMPRLLDRWARAVEAVDAAAAARAVDALAAKVAALAAAGRRRSGEEEWNEEEGKKKVCTGLAVAFAAVAETGGAAAAAYEGLVVELEERESAEAGREEI